MNLFTVIDSVFIFVIYHVMFFRNHIRPSVSQILLVPGFYSHFKMDHVNELNEYDTDLGLEFDENEVYQDFLYVDKRKFGLAFKFYFCELF